MWTEKQIQDHKEAAGYLAQILETTLDFLRSHPHCDELSVIDLILENYRKFGLITTERPIVAFRENSAQVHYFADVDTNKKLRPDSLVLIDLWAAKRGSYSPFADITAMAYYGQTIPKKQLEAFTHVATSRDLAVDYLRQQITNGKIPTGSEVDLVARDYFQKFNLHNNFLHSLGHSIGNSSPHGRYGHLKRTNKNQINKNLGYTIEPGLYFKDDFGIRSEIDFYISNNELTITTLVQKEIILI